MLKKINMANVGAAVACLAIGGGFSLAMADNDSAGSDSFVPDRSVGGSEMTAVTMADEPTGQRWAVVSYVSRDDGDRCLYAGPLVGEQVGQYNLNGEFSPVLPSDAAGDCGDFEKSGWVKAYVPFAKDGAPRFVAYGTVSPSANAARLVSPDGSVIDAATSTRDRTFLAIVEPSKDADLTSQLRDIRIEERTGGSTKPSTWVPIAEQDPR